VRDRLITWRAHVARLRARFARRFIRLFQPQLAQARSKKPDAEVYLVSYPKAGRTWLRVLVGKALCLTYALPDRLILDTEELSRQAGIARTGFWHDDSDLGHQLHYRWLSADKRAYTRAKVVLLVRDVRDILVSSYFQASKRERVFPDRLSEFVRSDVFGARKVATFYDLWYRSRTVPKALLVVHYEELHEDPARVLGQVLYFMGVESADEAVLQEAVAYAGFQSMRRLETADYFGTQRLRPADPGDDESYKVRRGVVGGYRDYLSQADIDYIDRVVAAVGCPWIQPRGPAPVAVRSDDSRRRPICSDRQQEPN
jgi:hypothetical protein